MATFKTLQKALLERALEGELGHHLGYRKSTLIVVMGIAQRPS